MNPYAAILTALSQRKQNSLLDQVANNLLGAPMSAASMYYEMSPRGDYDAIMRGAKSAEEANEQGWFSVPEGEYKGTIGGMPRFTPPAANALLEFGSAAPLGGDLLKGIGGLAGIMAGRGARTADLDMLKLAENAEAKGLPMERIRDATGWFKGADDKWRFEIDDSAMSTPEIRTWAAKQDLSMGNNAVVPLGQAVQHDAYGAAYPGTIGFGDEGTRTVAALNPSSPGGSYHADKNMIISPAVRTVDSPIFKADKSVTAHEMQHLVEDREGFARGGSPAEFKQQKDAVDAFAVRSWLKEVDQMQAKMPNADRHAVENAVINEYQQANAMDWVPPREVRDLANQPYMRDPETIKEMDRLIDFYGLDKRTRPYSPHEMYERLAGEVEARNVQKRLPLSADDRRMLSPMATQDVRTADQIVRHGSAPVQMSDTDWRGLHRPPDRAPHTSLDDMSDIYPEDIYSPQGARYYGGGDARLDEQAVQVMREARGNPDKMVTVYRAVPAGVDQKLHPGDWVTPTKEYAEFHGSSWVGDDYQIIEEKVRAGDLFTEGNSLHEFGWVPE